MNRLPLFGTARICCAMVLLALTSVLAVSAQAASVYKCTGAQGQVAFQDKPCAASAVQTNVELAVAPAHALSPDYAPVDESATSRRLHRGASSTRHATRESKSGGGAYECRTADGQVFYRLAACPHSVRAADGATRNGRGRDTVRNVSVNSMHVSREEACSQMRRAGAAGRSGRVHDQDVSTYDKNLGRDPCA